MRCTQNRMPPESYHLPICTANLISYTVIPRVDDDRHKRYPFKIMSSSTIQLHLSTTQVYKTKDGKEYGHRSTGFIMDTGVDDFLDNRLET